MKTKESEMKLIPSEYRQQTRNKRSRREFDLDRKHCDETQILNSPTIQIIQYSH